MSDTAFSGPVIVFGQSAAGFDNNPDASPSMFWAGAGYLDPRAAYTYIPGEAQSAPDLMWLGFDNITTLSQAPYALSTAAVVASANPTTATLTLVSANSATTGVGIVPSIVRADTGATDTNGGAGFVALDSFTSVTASIVNGVLIVTANAAGLIPIGATILTSGTVTSGSITALTAVTGAINASGGVGSYQLNNATLNANSGTVTLLVNGVIPITGTSGRTAPNSTVPFGSPSSNYAWNPAALVGRALSITAAAGATYTTATISGYDIYGFPMVEAITITAGSTVNGKKAWKYVKSVVLSGGTADTTHAYSVGTTDIYGLPIRSDSFGDILINYAASLTASTLVTAATGYVAADLTSPATATTGDVRGTYALQTAAATGINKLSVRQSPQAYNTGSAVGLFGVSQFANF